ncbi:MAG: hypothetical protein AAFO58_07980 [Pseudomonadota bacterium]
MDSLVLRTAIWRNIASLLVTGAALGVCVVQVYQGQAFWDWGLTDPKHENLMRIAFVFAALLCSWGVSRDLDRLILRTPVFYANADGVAIRGGQIIPWSAFEGVVIGGFTVNYIFTVRHLEIHAGGKHTIPAFQLSHRPAKMAAIIMGYAEHVAQGGAASDHRTETAQPIMPRRPRFRQQEPEAILA